MIIHTIKKLLLITGGLICYNSLSAQQTFSAAGDKANGDGGSANYVVGQVVYSSYSANGKKINQGVLQPYEISTVTGFEEEHILLELAAYPNPVNNTLWLKTKNRHSAKASLSYQLVDFAGKLIKQQIIQANPEAIDMGQLPSGIYLFKVSDSERTLKTFKIIKN